MSTVIYKLLKINIFIIITWSSGS